jgi:hypothetical protein
MIRSFTHLCGDKLAALDGDIGQVKSVYFDLPGWVARYLVAETGGWLASRQVLIPTHAIRGVRRIDNVVTVNLTRKQIEDSPSLEWHKPVSRKYEEEYHQYYRWPGYWENDSLRRGIGLHTNQSTTDADLRSTRAVKGYEVQTGSEIIGQVCDFLIDDESWNIPQLVMNPARHPAGKKRIQIPTNSVSRISYLDSTVFLNLAREAVEASPALDLA